MTGVVVTGVGLATAAGAGTAATWERWLSGTTALSPPAGEWAHWPCALVGHAEIPDCGPLLPVPKLAKYAGRSVALLVHAAHEALADATRAGAPRVEPSRVGVYVASGQTGLQPATFFPALSAAWPDADSPDYGALGGRPARLIEPHFSLTTLANLGVAFLSLMAGAEGPSTNVVHDATAGVSALSAALDDLRRGLVARAIVGAHDSWLVEQAALGLARRGWLLPRGVDAVRPFDQEGAGLAPAEGAAVVVLDAVDRAGAADHREGERDRAVRLPWRPGSSGTVEVLVTGAATATPPPRDGRDAWSVQATCEASRAVGTASGDVILAHGSGIASLDESEAIALAEAAPGAAAITSFTGVLGSLGAATALVQGVLATTMLRTGRVPPVTGQRRPAGEVPWPTRRTSLAGFDAVTMITRAAQGQAGAIRLRGVPSSAQSTSWTP